MARAICVVLVCGLTAPAAGSPRSDPTAGRAVFTGATTPDATSLDLDPAAIGLGTVDEVYVAATAVLDQLHIARKNLDLATGNLSPGADTHETTLGPGGMAAFLWHIANGEVTLGLELLSPPAEEFPADQRALQYSTLGGSHHTYSGVFGFSYRVTNDFYAGLSLAVGTRYLRLHYARDTALAAGHGPGGIDSDCDGSPCGVENSVATEHYDVSVHSSLFSTDAVTANIGLMYQIAKDTWLAVGYHTPPGLAVQNELDGSMDVRRAARDGGGVVAGGATVMVSEPASADAELRARLPQRLDLHVGMRWVDLSRLGAYDVRGYGESFPAANVPEWTERPLGFRDPFALWAGVEQIDAGERWRLGGRIGFETAAVDADKTSPMAIAPTSVTADLGAQLRLTPAIVVQLMYGLQYFPTVDVTQSAFDPRDRIACIDSGFDYSTSACEATRLGYAIPTAAGDYGRIEHSFRLAIRYALR